MKLNYPYPRWANPPHDIHFLSLLQKLNLVGGFMYSHDNIYFLPEGHS